MPKTNQVNNSNKIWQPIAKGSKLSPTQNNWPEQPEVVKMADVLTEKPKPMLKAMMETEGETPTKRLPNLWMKYSSDSVIEKCLE